MTERLLTAQEVAALLAVPVSWVREHTRSGALPHVALGRYRRYRESTLAAWIEEQEHAGRWRKHRPKPLDGTRAGTGDARMAQLKQNLPVSET